MPSALKLGCKHQRQRQAQKKREKHTRFILVGFTDTPLLPSFFSASKTRYPLPQNFRKSSFNMRETTPTRIWRIPPPFLFPSFSPPPLLFFSPFFIHSSRFFFPVFLLHKHLSSLHFTILQPRELTQSVSDFPSSKNTPLFMRSKLTALTHLLNHQVSK